MKRTISLLALLLILMGAYFLFFYDTGSSTLDKDEIAFAVEDTASVQRIVISRVLDGDEVERRVLERNPNGGWTLDGTHGALEPKVKVLLGTLHLIHVREVLKDKGRETVLEMMDANHLLVETFGEKGLIKSIKVGTNTPDAKGTAMMLSKAKNPYIVVLPGFEGYPSSMMTLDFDVWRENLLFNAKPSSLAEVRIDYGKDASPVHLVLEESSGNWGLKGMKVQADSAVFAAKVAAYLNQFQGKVYGLAFVNESFPGKIDTLKTQQPDITFSLTLQNQAPRKLNLFRSSVKGGNYLGYIEGENELRAIQTFVMDKYLAKQEDFLP